MHSPALEFAKAVCHVMSLDKSLEEDVLKLKNNLMKMMDVRSFSPQAQFQNPCLTFVLPDVICSFCNNRRDLDLCRDPGLVEAELVGIINRRNVSYTVQDLMCKKCGKVK